MMLKTRHNREGAGVFLCSVPSIYLDSHKSKFKKRMLKVGHLTLKVVS